MGSSGSSHDEHKTVDSSGAVNNNLVFEEPVPTHSTTMIVLVSVICAIKILELCIYIYKEHRKNLKKRYNTNVIQV